MKKISAVVLAAGLSTRFGARDKLLHPYYDRPLLEWILGTVTQAALFEPVVVIGPDDRAKCDLVNRYALRVVENPAAATGMASSLRVGVSALPAAIDGFFVCLGDMPDITAAHLTQLAECFSSRDSTAIIAPCFGGQRGHPVLFGAHYQEHFQNLQGDEGARQILQRAGTKLILIEMSDRSVLRDLDTLGDFN